MKMHQDTLVNYSFVLLTLYSNHIQGPRIEEQVYPLIGLRGIRNLQINRHAIPAVANTMLC
jgi:hypothetical protein